MFKHIFGKTEDPRPSLERNDTQSTESSIDRQEARVNGFHSLILSFLPVYVECTRGAVSLGNESTRALVVSTFSRATGHFDANAAEDKDIFRQVFDFEIENTVVQMKPNPDYRRPQHVAAERIIQGLDDDEQTRRWWHLGNKFRQRRHHTSTNLRNLMPGRRRSVESFRAASFYDSSRAPYDAFDTEGHEGTVWHGLDRYLDDSERDDHEAWAHVDYARFSTILDVPAIHFNFYWDIQGPVSEFDSAKASSTDVNGAPPPGYGMILTVKGGDVNYGPWADRLRLEIQGAFFPNPYHSSKPAEPTKVGDLRQYTIMNIAVDIENDVTLRVPTREPSKDWHWRGRANAAREAAMQKQHQAKRHFRFRRSAKTTAGPEVRPFGWMSFTVAKRSTVQYVMAMLPGPNGFPNSLLLNLKDVRASSSVNHDLLWRCPSHKIEADLSYPLVWNDLHKWTFNVQSDQLDMFILRDHMFLLIDLIADFTEGVKSDFMTFVPFHYDIGLLFNDLKLFLNSNDFNIIDNPCSTDDNAFLILGFQRLAGLVGIPLQYYAPRQGMVTFKADGQNAFLDISSPVWSTLNTFLEDPMVPDLKTLMTLKGLDMVGSYNFYTAQRPDLNDCLIMTINGYTPKFFLHGFLVRYFINVKNNYFGDHIHFRTLEEYQNLLDEIDRGIHYESYPPKNENDLDVLLGVKADQVSILLPSNIYTRRKAIRADILLAEADMRFTNYYMDLQVNSSPLELCVETITSPLERPDMTNCQLYIESVVVVGHRLFGAPPTEPPYASHWDVDAGLITGEISADFLRTMVEAGKALAFTMDDFENALPPTLTKTIHDVVFVRVKAAGARLWMLSEHAAFLCELSPATVDFNDWAGRSFATHLSVDVPQITIGAVELKSALRHKESSHAPVETLALFKTSLRLATLDKTENLAEKRALQQQHIRYQDQRTHRADWLLTHPMNKDSSPPAQWGRDPPSMPLPSMPEPIHDANAHRAGLTDVKVRRLKHQSSFLSSNSSTHSVIRGKRRRPNGNGNVGDVDHRKQRNRLDTTNRKDFADMPTSDKSSKRAGRLNMKSVTLSGPWTAPHFPLEDVEPSTEDMPPTRPLSPAALRRRAKRPTLVEEDTEEQKGIGHIGIICFLENGLSGFCKPALFTSVVGLIQDLQPKEALDCLDTVQQGVIGLVAKRLMPKDSSKNVDIAVRLPFSSIRLVHRSADGIGAVACNDQYDVNIKDGHADVRIMMRHNHSLDDKPIASDLLVHSSVRRLGIAVTDNALKASGPARAAITLSDVGIWMSSTQRLRGSVQLSDMTAELSASRIEQMAEILYRSATMIEHIADPFTKMDDSLRTQHLVLHLTQAATAAPDPVFLTRPSYVLRSAPSHMRTSESWKVLARLRYTFWVASNEGRFDMCPCQNEELSDSARAHMRSIFDQWKAWDAVPDNRMPIMASLFGQDVKADGTEGPPKPVQMEIAIGRLALVLDPGPHQSSVTMKGIEAGIDLSPDELADASAKYAQKLAVQAYLAEFAIDLDWSLIELTGSILRLVRKSSGAQADPVQEVSPLSSTDSLEPPPVDLLAIEIVVGADLVSIALRSVNLRLKLGAEDFTTSFLHTPRTIDPPPDIFAIASTTAMAKIDGLQKTLLSWKLTSPKIYGSVLNSIAGQDPAVMLRMGAACERLRFNLKEDVPAIMGVVQQVIEVEVRAVHQQLLHLPHDDLEAVEREIEPKVHRRVDLHLFLFLGDYKLDFTLLPTVRYAIAGKVARTSVIPNGEGHLVVNFDLKQHEHSFRGVWSQAYEAPALLQMPPINGQVSVITTTKSTTIRLHTAVELIRFEAAAVRACFDVVNQPGFLTAVRSLQADGERIQQRATEILGPAKQPQHISHKKGATIRFAVDGTLAGIRVHCIAPSLKDDGTLADLAFVLGATTMGVHNIVPDSENAFEKPQFGVNVREISLGIGRKTQYGSMNFGKATTAVRISGVTETDEKGGLLQRYHAVSKGISVDMYEQTAALVVDVVAFLQDRIKSITISDEAKKLKPVRRLTMANIKERNAIVAQQNMHPIAEDAIDDSADTSSNLFDFVFGVEIDRVQVRWGLHETTTPLSSGRGLEDLIFSIRSIDLQTRREGSARLSILDLQLQLVPHAQDPVERTSNSALLPEMIFSSAYVSTKRDRRFAFQAKGKALDLRLAADFVVPASMIQKSVAGAALELRTAKSRFGSKAATPEAKRSYGSLLGNKRLASLLVDVDFAGAVVHVSSRREEGSTSSVFGLLKGPRRSRAGRYGQIIQGSDDAQAVLQAPGVAIKVEYRDNGKDDPNLGTEIKVAASSNTLYPSVVPLVLDISASIKEMLGDQPAEEESKDSSDNKPATNYLSDATFASGDPEAILGKCKLKAGLWIQRQEFSLSCQPIARVSATAKFEDIFVNVNTVQGADQDRFFSLLTTFNKLQASVQHVYSRESTASFELDSIVLSMMNSKHVSGTTGISAILNISPMKMDINAKQMQDFLLFREIWYPKEIRGTAKVEPTVVSATEDTQAFAIQRYQQIAASGTLPWSAVVSIQELRMKVDFGPNIGQSTFLVEKLWASSKKNSDAEQNLCVGFEKIGVDSSGRMSGFVELSNFRVRTSIRWPEDLKTSTRAPLVQASVGFDHLRLKAAFDYQPFGVADISMFEALMYNVRQPDNQNDRLVATLDGGKVQAFVTALAGAQILALTQAFERLVVEKQEDYQSALQELDRHLRRKSAFPSANWTAPAASDPAKKSGPKTRGNFNLHTDVVVSLGAVDLGIFPSTFFDNQILKVDAVDAQARFAVGGDMRTQSGLGMKLGQVRVALSAVSRPNTKALGEVDVTDVINRATSARGGTIMKVPRLVSSMQTWQAPGSNTIEYIFRSTFEGKVDVGWNYSRISFIRGMWQTHARAFAQRLGKPPPEPALKITAEPGKEGAGGRKGQEKITAVVNMPKSKFNYIALEPPIIETPQLRDLGEATPSLEWIGLHRDRLPEATHSVAIVSLLEIAREVEDAYVRILGSA